MKCSSTPPRVTIICRAGMARSTNSNVCWPCTTQPHLNRRHGFQDHDPDTTPRAPLAAAAHAGSRATCAGRSLSPRSVAPASGHRSASADGVPEMVELILTTFDWVPATPRGYVRDIRVRWALEEAGLPYRVRST